MPTKFFAAAGSVLSLLPLLVSTSLQAHGWIVSPPSRQQFCASGQAGFDCGDVKYEPQSVEAVKGSSLCSGGGRFSILDENLNWPLTQSRRDLTFVWQLTAPHRTSNWEYFVDGQLFWSVSQGNQVPGKNVTHVVNGLPTGRHTVLAVWNISDTVNAFYSCVDLVIQ